MAERSTYKLPFKGKQIEQTLGRIINGELDDAVDAAQTAAGEAVEAAKTAVEYSGNPPKIEGGTWWIWDAVAGAYTDTGLAAQGNLLFATFDLDPRTGVLTMVTPEDYAGPTFILTEDGRLEVVANG